MVLTSPGLPDRDARDSVRPVRFAGCPVRCCCSPRQTGGRYRQPVARPVPATVSYVPTHHYSQNDDPVILSRGWCFKFGAFSFLLFHAAIMFLVPVVFYQHPYMTHGFGKRDFPD